jgi:hypothetical protein
MAGKARSNSGRARHIARIHWDPRPAERQRFRLHQAALKKLGWRTIVINLNRNPPFVWVIQRFPIVTGGNGGGFSFLISDFGFPISACGNPQCAIPNTECPSNWSFQSLFARSHERGYGRG